MEVPPSWPHLNLVDSQGPASKYHHTGGQSFNIIREREGNMHIYSITEVTDGNEEHVLGNWGKGDPCYKVAEDFAELCSIG